MNSAPRWEVCAVGGYVAAPSPLHKGTWRYWHWMSWILRCGSKTEVAGLLWELLCEPQVEVAEPLQQNLQLLGGREDGHPGQKMARRMWLILDVAKSEVMYIFTNFRPKRHKNHRKDLAVGRTTYRKWKVPSLWPKPLPGTRQIPSSSSSFIQ